MQDKINALASIGGTAAESQPSSHSVQLAKPQEPAAPSGGFDAADEIRKYKELLDSGAITQEEYEQKKKQLLGL